MIETTDNQSVEASVRSPSALNEPELDDLFDQAVELIRESQEASIGRIQNNMRIGYNRAARIMEQLEANDVVSAPNSHGTRKVLIELSDKG